MVFATLSCAGLDSPPGASARPANGDMTSLLSAITRSARRATTIVLALGLAIQMIGCRSAAPQANRAAVANGGAPRNESSAGAPKSAAIAPLSGMTLATHRQPIAPRDQADDAHAAAPVERTPASDATTNGADASSAESLDAPNPSLDEALTEDEVVGWVLAVNPTIEAMSSAWRAASSRYPQAIALDDPMFSSALAPASFRSNLVEGAYALQGSQKFPWFGKRQARGRQANAEAGAAFQDLQTARVTMVESARFAFLDYYMVARLVELNEQNLATVRQFRHGARAKYESNQATQQDLLQADVELAELERRAIELNRMRQIALARINALLARDVAEPLPPPPPSLSTTFALTPIDVLRARALAERPELAALAAKIRAECAALDSARLAYYPDVEVYGRYDTFWQPADTQKDLRGQVGVNMNMPIYRERRAAAVREAAAKVSQRQAEFRQQAATVEYEVASAWESLQESLRAAEIDRLRIIPTARQNVAAARANYDSNVGDFLQLLTAQRQLIAAQQKQQETIVDCRRRRAALERAVGGPLGE